MNTTQKFTEAVIKRVRKGSRLGEVFDILIEHCHREIMLSENGECSTEFIQRMWLHVRNLEKFYPVMICVEAYSDRQTEISRYCKFAGIVETICEEIEAIYDNLYKYLKRNSIDNEKEIRRVSIMHKFRETVINKVKYNYELDKDFDTLVRCCIDEMLFFGNGTCSAKFIQYMWPESLKIGEFNGKQDVKTYYSFVWHMQMICEEIEKVYKDLYKHLKRNDSDEEEEKSMRLFGDAIHHKNEEEELKHDDSDDKEIETKVFNLMLSKTYGVDRSEVVDREIEIKEESNAKMSHVDVVIKVAKGLAGLDPKYDFLIEDYVNSVFDSENLEKNDEEAFLTFIKHEINTFRDCEAFEDLRNEDEKQFVENVANLLLRVQTGMLTAIYYIGKASGESDDSDEEKKDEEEKEGVKGEVVKGFPANSIGGSKL